MNLDLSLSLSASIKFEHFSTIFKKILCNSLCIARLAIFFAKFSLDSHHLSFKFFLGVCIFYFDKCNLCFQFRVRPIKIITWQKFPMRIASQPTVVFLFAQCNEFSARLESLVSNRYVELNFSRHLGAGGRVVKLRN